MSYEGLTGDYEPSPSPGVRQQVQEYETSGGTRGTTMRGMPVVLLTMRGAKSGKLRKVPLMRVEHEGRYAAVASMGGAPQHPIWYYNLIADPRVVVQDGPQVHHLVAREVSGAEKEQWWQRSVDAFADYADYQAKTDRLIPVLVLEAADDARG